MRLNSASREQLQQWHQQLTIEYDQLCARKLSLDLTRGKPSAEQLDLSNALDGILQNRYIDHGNDLRNYGGIEGIAQARQMGADVLGVPAANVFAGGNSSLAMMHQLMTWCMFFGPEGKGSAWFEEGTVKFLCPSPGYDRHFAICEQLGIEMLVVGMNEHGPDMDHVESLVASDPSIKGMWCVPKYSNPTGCIYSDDTVRRIAALGLIAPTNFRVFWDNAYAIHDLDDQAQSLHSLWHTCTEAGTPDLAFHFASTSKITFAGAGVAFLAASEANLARIKDYLAKATIGPDKVNQQRHAVLLPDKAALLAHMHKHAGLLKPRFDCVLRHLKQGLGINGDMGSWTAPLGGYFVSFNSLPGLADRIVQLAAKAGVKLTPAGATYPYGKDTENRNIRIAPSFPSLPDIDQAMLVFVLAVKLASLEQALLKLK